MQRREIFLATAHQSPTIDRFTYRKAVMSKVMIVDDAEPARQTLTRLLRREGFETLGAASGNEALHLLRQHLPDLILLDVFMPDLSGLELLEMLHDNPDWREVPVIMLTAACDTHCVHRAEQLGAKEYLVKAAFSVNEMLEHVRKYTTPKSEPLAYDS